MVQNRANFNVDSSAVFGAWGHAVRVLRTFPIPVSDAILAERSDVAFPENGVPDEMGRLTISPTNDGDFRIDLHYLRYDDQESDDVSVYAMQFLPDFFMEHPPGEIAGNLPFHFEPDGGAHQFALCAQTCALLDALQAPDAEAGRSKEARLIRTALQLLKRAISSIVVPFTVCPVPACRFLVFESEREKIRDACQIIQENLDTRYTIREISRMVAINECYLKKGIKALTGKTVYEYREHLRIDHARELLGAGKSVTDVANTLGYSSISHFSTAFKRATGLKPCELLG